MAETQEQTEGLDIVKIYMCGMGALIIVSISWMLYNYTLLSRYQKAYKLAKSDIEHIIELEKTLPPKPSYNSEDVVIINEFQFFKNTDRSLPYKPELEPPPPWDVININGIDIAEKTYTIRFEKQGIERRQLARYIFTIQKEKPFLKVKRLEIERDQKAEPYQDKWKATIEFVMRKPHIEE